MNFENGADESILFPPDPLSCLYSFKEELLEKVTNHNISELAKYSHFPHAFENSPHRGSFFFTPNSPKPLRFELAPDSSHPLHHTAASMSGRHAISRKLNLEEEFEQVEQNDSPSPEALLRPCGANRSAKNSKGLKNLSESVYTIVSQLGITKYKEVADLLVSQILSEEDGDRRKDEHNVKRRVYDALNVLIAAGLLRKEGKDVVCNERFIQENEASVDPYQLREKQKYFAQLQAKMTAIAQKQEKLEKLQKKKALIEYIINRNRMEPQIEKQMLRFPLIGTMVSNLSGSSIKLVGSNVLLVRLREKVRLHGDVDLLLQINKDKIEMDNLLNNICCSHEENECKMEDD